jgi:hypothetical protein
MTPGTRPWGQLPDSKWLNISSKTRITFHFMFIPVFLPCEHTTFSRTKDRAEIKSSS